MQVAYLCRKDATDRQSDMDGNMKRSSLTVQREEHVKTLVKKPEEEDHL
jgi:hypothetical protein